MVIHYIIKYKENGWCGGATMKYVAAGNVMTDIEEFADGTRSDMHIGGPAFFALSGIRLWTDDVKLLSNVGLDFETEYGLWLDRHNISRESVRVGADHTTHHQLQYHEDGSYGHTSVYGAENMGVLKVTPAQLLSDTVGAKGVYLAQNTDSVFWKGLAKAHETNGFTYMWEIEAPFCYYENLERVRECCHMAADCFSINGNEASKLFNIPRENEEDMINELMKLDVSYTWFRVGIKGAYSITKTNAYFVPTIMGENEQDPTGCGNSSTGAALYAYCEGYDPVMIGAIANVTSSYNVKQYGPYPRYTPEVRLAALKQAQDYADQIKKKLNK